MKKSYKIVGEDLTHPQASIGTTLRIKNIFSGRIHLRTAREILNDKTLIQKLPPADLIKIGYLLAEEQYNTASCI